MGEGMGGNNSGVPNRPVRPALGPAGLTQAFSETAGPDCGKAAFQKGKAGPGLGDLQASDFLTLTLPPFLQIKVRVDTRHFWCCDNLASNFTSG